MATDWSSSKKENTNFACLCRLLVDAGTRVLRDIFDSVNPPSTLHSVLHDPAVHNTLQGLKAKKVLTPNQWERLYPKTGTTVTSAGFDITLLFVLLRNICGLSPPPTGWDNLPTPTNKTMEADLARVKFYRNELYGHITEAALSDSEFEKNWKEISGVLIRLGGPRYKPDVERLKVQSMDSEVENNLIKTLKEWEEAEKDLKMAIIKIEKKLEQQIVTHSEGNLYPELVVKCMFKFATGATWLAGSSYLIYHHKDNPKGLITTVSAVVLPTGILVHEIIRGSINIIIKATTLVALEELWTRYKEGILKEDLEKGFLTEELRAQAGEDVELVVEMNEEEYTEAKQKLAVEVYKEDYTQVPAEVLARGEKAKEAYQRALEEGEVEVYRGRIMLIGQDRAGKTSLKKALLSLTFDPKEPSTVGVDVDPSEFCVDVDNVIDWHKVKGNKKNDFEDVVAKMIAEKIKPEKKIERTKDPEPGLEPPKPKEIHELPTDDINEVQDSKVEPSMSVEEASIQHEDDEGLNDTVNTGNDATKSLENYDSNMMTFPKKGKEEHESTISDENVTGDVGVPENLIKRLKSKNLDEFSSKDKVTVNIWDFAGHHLYYASHPVFFSPRAVYVLVYNLNKDLKAEAEPCVRQGVHDIKLDNHERQTNLEAILSWLVSVHNARPEYDDRELPYVRPPVIIVGTHADCPFEKPVTEMETIIKESVNEKTYDQHVVRPYITVDNTLSSKDEGVKKLKDKIKELFRMEPYMGERVPFRWFIFERVIRSLLEDKKIYHLQLKDLEKAIVDVCHLNNQDEITAMLNFYHDLGVIVKHGNTVVLQAEWLIDLFRKLITIRPYDDENPVHSKHWKNLEKCGILDMDLVEHVFKEIIENDETTKNDILEMMEHYGLIARFSTADKFHYFVPCQLQSSPGELIDAEPSTSDPCALYFHFTDGFIPHGLYYCLVSRMIAWCSDQGYPQEPILFKNVSRFFIGNFCQCDLLLICRKRSVKVVLRSHVVEGSLDIQPAFLVRSFLEECLTDLKDEHHGYRSLTYETSVLCPTCSESDTVCDVHNCVSCRDDDCLPFLPVGNNQVLLCKKPFCKNSRPKVPTLKEWYRDPSTVAVVPGKEPKKGARFSVSSTFNLDDNQKRWLVIGISLKVLLPTLREFVKQKMEDHYDDLKANHNIDKQSYSTHLVNDGKRDKLNYRSINNNSAIKGERNYDYKVTSAVDLAKLYLQPCMAKFTDFDETCELSAVLGILSSASVFSADVQDSASRVRQDVRNEWGHCNFKTWDKSKFASCFDLMDCLLKALMLKSGDEKLITEKLQDWENKGV